MDKNTSYWYAVHTKPRWEKKVAALLDDAGINHYCPLNKVMRQWSDRKKVVQEPLFKGYVFVQVAEDEKFKVLQVNGIVNFVYWLGKPATIRDNEIDTIKRFLNEFGSIEILKTELKPDKTVRIKQGLLMNYKGIVLELNGNKAKVRIESMGIQLSAFFDRKNLEVVGE